MKTKQATHTPGPWTLKEGFGTTVLNSDGRLLNLDARTNEGMANARLIAAAPELLSLIKDFGDWLEVHLELGHINAGTANRNGDLVSQIRTVIAKAEGHKS